MRDAIRGRSGRVLLALGTAAAGAVLSWTYLGVDRPIGIDDANIFMTYARNLADGHGFVYNVGGERVEGVTSLLWTGMMALGYLVTDGPEPVFLAATVLFAAGSTFLALELVRQGEAGRCWPLSPAFVTAGVLLLFPWYWGWSTVTLMEVALWTFLVHLFVWALAGAETRPWGTGLAAAVIVALAPTRPESMVLVPVLLGIAWCVGRLTVGRAGLLLAVHALAVVGLVGIRLAYFGFPLPNTYYAKVSPDVVERVSAGFVYLAGALFSEPVLIPLLAAAAGWIVWGFVHRAPGDAAPPGVTTLAAAGAMAVCTVTVLSGGDHFAGYRFVQPAIPLLVVSGVLALDAGLRPVPGASRVGASRGPVRALAGGLAALAFAGILLARWDDLSDAGGIQVEIGIAEEGRAAARVLQEALAERDALPSVGVVTAGGFGLVYGGTTLDLLGLNWVAMGHSDGGREGYLGHAAFDPAVLWARPPALAIPRRANEGWDAGLACTYWLQPIRELLRSRRFREAYVPAVVGTPPDRFSVYVRRDVHTGPAFRRLEWVPCDGPGAARTGASTPTVSENGSRS